MSGGEWTVVLASATGVVTAIGTAFGVLINLLITQSKETIGEIRKDRDYWRERAERCEMSRIISGQTSSPAR